MAVEPPRPGTISKQKLHELLASRGIDLTDRRLIQLAEEEHLFPRPIRGQYEFLPTLLGLIKHYAELYHEKDDREKAAIIKLREAKASTAEEMLAILREQYVRKDEIEPALRNVSLHQRAVLQRKLESELAPNLAGLKTPETRVRMALAVDDICNVFRDGVRSWLEKAP